MHAPPDGDDYDTGYYLNKLRAISAHSVWVYERKNVLETGYWHMLMFDKHHEKAFLIPVIPQVCERK